MRILSVCVALSAAFMPPAAFALGAPLERPSLAVPSGTDAAALLKTLSDERFDFVTGWFINAHTVLYYRGDAQDLSAFIAELRRHEEFQVSLMFSAEAGRATSKFPFGDKGVVNAPCDWSVEHHAWGDATVLTVTVFHGEEKVGRQIWDRTPPDRPFGVSALPVEAPRPLDPIEPPSPSETE